MSERTPQGDAKVCAEIARLAQAYGRVSIWYQDHEGKRDWIVAAGENPDREYFGETLAIAVFRASMALLP